jgi:hypothetical protein
MVYMACTHDKVEVLLALPSEGSNLFESLGKLNHVAWNASVNHENPVVINLVKRNRRIQKVNILFTEFVSDSKKFRSLFSHAGCSIRPNLKVLPESLVLVFVVPFHENNRVGLRKFTNELHYASTVGTLVDKVTNEGNLISRGQIETGNKAL